MGKPEKEADKVKSWSVFKFMASIMLVGIGIDTVVLFVDALGAPIDLEKVIVFGIIICLAIPVGLWGMSS